MTLLYLDFDHAVPRTLAGQLGAWVAPLWRRRVLWRRYDRTRHGWHVVIALSGTITPLECVAMQAVLGSDPRREAYNVVRARAVARGDVPAFWRTRWNVLYRQHWTRKRRRV